MPRFWTSFWAADPRSIGGDPASTFFCTGYRDADPECSICVLAEGPDAEAVMAAVRAPEMYPEAELRFIEPVDPDFNPNSGGRFPGIHLWQIANPQQKGPAIDQ